MENKDQGRILKTILNEWNFAPPHSFLILELLFQ